MTNKFKVGDRVKGTSDWSATYGIKGTITDRNIITYEVTFDFTDGCCKDKWSMEEEELELVND